LADFDGDGKSDILWRHNATGQLYIWLMNGLNLADLGCPGTIVDPAWQILGTADFSCDDKADLLWQNSSTGQRYLWIMSGREATATAPLADNYLGGHLERIADFNGDGKADMLWRNGGTGQVYLWLMNATQISVEGVPITVGNLSWTIQK
jgi:hypothetical protein